MDTNAHGNNDRFEKGPVSKESARKYLAKYLPMLQAHLMTPVASPACTALLAAMEIMLAAFRAPSFNEGTAGRAAMVAASTLYDCIRHSNVGSAAHTEYVESQVRRQRSIDVPWMKVINALMSDITWRGLLKYVPAFVIEGVMRDFITTGIARGSQFHSRVVKPLLKGLMSKSMHRRRFTIAILWVLEETIECAAADDEMHQVDALFDALGVVLAFASAVPGLDVSTAGITVFRLSSNDRHHLFMLLQTDPFQSVRLLDDRWAQAFVMTKLLGEWHDRRMTILPAFVGTLSPAARANAVAWMAESFKPFYHRVAHSREVANA